MGFQTVEASGGQINPSSTVQDVAKLDFAKVNPVNGPIFVHAAEPGDSLKVTLERFDMAGWGWTANIPGFGLLADQFTEPALHIWKFDPATLAPAMCGPAGRVPLKPFAGTNGLAPAQPGPHSIVPPQGSAAIWMSLLQVKKVLNPRPKHNLRGYYNSSLLGGE